MQESQGIQKGQVWGKFKREGGQNEKKSKMEKVKDRKKVEN